MSRQNLLLLEIDPQVADSYELFLAARGAKVTSVSSLAAALRAAQTCPPEVAIVGTLPDTLDIGTVAARLRAMVSPRPLMVVTLSPCMDEIDAVDVVIPRGAHPRALLDAVRNAYRRRPVTAPLATVS